MGCELTVSAHGPQDGNQARAAQIAALLVGERAQQTKAGCGAPAPQSRIGCDAAFCICRTSSAPRLWTAGSSVENPNRRDRAQGKNWPATAHQNESHAWAIRAPSGAQGCELLGLRAPSSILCSNFPFAVV